MSNKINNKNNEITEVDITILDTFPYFLYSFDFSRNNSFTLSKTYLIISS